MLPLTSSFFSAVPVLGSHANGGRSPGHSGLGVQAKESAALEVSRAHRIYFREKTTKERVNEGKR